MCQGSELLRFLASRRSLKKKKKGHKFLPRCRTSKCVFIWCSADFNVSPRALPWRAGLSSFLVLPTPVKQKGEKRMSSFFQGEALSSGMFVYNVSQAYNVQLAFACCWCVLHLPCLMVSRAIVKHLSEQYRAVI